MVLAFSVLTCLLLVCAISARDVYLEEIPSEWIYSDDNVTHFIVFDGNEYFNDNTTINTFNTATMDSALAKVKVSKDAEETIVVSASDIGTKYLTKFIFPKTTTTGSPVTNVNLNSLKSNGTYFWGKIGSVVLPSTVTETSDMNQTVGNLRHIDFGEGSQLQKIPGHFCNAAAKLSCVENFPTNVTEIGSNAFNNCKNALRGVLYISATNVGAGAFNNATTFLTGIIFGPNLKSIGGQTFCSRNNETGLGNPQATFIEFQCSVSALSLTPIGNDKGSFNFAPNSGNSRSPYSSLKCIILSHADDIALINSGKTTIQEINPNIYFDEKGDNIVTTSHKQGELSDAPIYTSYYETGYIRYTCPDCGKEEATPMAPFFACLGYSRTEGEGLAPSITVGFKVDASALEAYVEFTGNKIEFGAIVVGAGELSFAPLDENGEVNQLVEANVFKVKINTDYFDCKIVGFNENQLDSKLMLGAYIIESKDGAITSIAYMQKSQVVGENYEFISYNTIKNN